MLCSRKVVLSINQLPPGPEARPRGHMHSLCSFILILLILLTVVRYESSVTSQVEKAIPPSHFRMAFWECSPVRLRHVSFCGRRRCLIFTEACRSSPAAFRKPRSRAWIHLGSKVLLPISLQHATLELCKEVCWLHTPLLLKGLLLQRKRVKWKLLCD